ncbi:MAG: GTPase, partial [Oscillospiraceae bacterium]
MAGKNKVKVEDRPGVTRDRQWVTLNGEIDIMDMPGVLWPKFEDKTVGEHLAFTGAVKDNVYDTEHLSARLLSFLKDNYYENIKSRYDIDDFEDKQGYEILEMIAKKRGMVLRGNELDTQRASIAVLDEFRAGLIGKITIEKI